MAENEIKEIGSAATENVNVRGKLLPHLLIATTDTSPPVVPTVATIEFVVEVPFQPVGKVHL